MNSDDKLFLLDAYALIYRAYYAFIKSPRINSKGFNTSAILGFCKYPGRSTQKENPTHIGSLSIPPDRPSAMRPTNNIRHNVRKLRKLSVFPYLL